MGGDTFWADAEQDRAILDFTSGQMSADSLGRAVPAAALDLVLHLTIVQLPGLGGVIRMAPPLTISETELHDGVDKLERAIAGAVGP